MAGPRTLSYYASVQDTTQAYVEPQPFEYGPDEDAIAVANLEKITNPENAQMQYYENSGNESDLYSHAVSNVDINYNFSKADFVLFFPKANPCRNFGSYCCSTGDKKVYPIL